MKERVIAYDYIRIFAMLLVVACHSFGDVSNTSPAIISILSYFEMPCNGLFIAVSGALLLPTNTPSDQSVNWLSKRLKKVGIPTVFWSVLYLVLKGDLSVKSVCSIPFSIQGASILWFMYTLVGLYIIAPVISPWLEKVNKSTLQLYLGIWAISLCYPILSNWLAINDGDNGFLYYLSGFVGYFVLGFYLKKYDVKLTTAIVLYIFAFVAMICVKLFAPDVALYHGLWYFSIICAINVVFWWKVLERISCHIHLSDKGKNTLVTISNLIFGVYFIHHGILEYVIPQIDGIQSLPYLLGYSVRIIIAFFGSLLLSWAISYLPFANYIIGYKK